MRILFVADGRSPIALNWIRYWLAKGEEVYLVSTFPCQPEAGLAGCFFLPVAFSQIKARGSGRRRPVVGLGLRAALRHWLGPLTLPRAGRDLHNLVQKIRPDFVHAMRVPYEGMLSAWAGLKVPLIVSVWGNDFTLHARATPLMMALTRFTLRHTAALHADCQRDVRLARRLGLAADRPTLVIPGNGGVRRDIFYPPAVPPEQPVIVNPRGLRAYVRTDTFFRAIPLVLKRQPKAFFRCVNMAGEAEAEKWVERLGIAPQVELLPPLPYSTMGEVFRGAQIAISPSIHDGTPNTLLEAMACGCFPIAGDIESLREWITPGYNGFLVDPCSPPALAEAVLMALTEADHRQEAARRNALLIAERAEYERCMALAEAFYACLLGEERS